MDVIDSLYKTHDLFLKWSIKQLVKSKDIKKYAVNQPHDAIQTLIMADIAS